MTKKAHDFKSIFSTHNSFDIMKEDRILSNIIIKGGTFCDANLRGITGSLTPCQELKLPPTQDKQTNFANRKQLEYEITRYNAKTELSKVEKKKIVVLETITDSLRVLASNCSELSVEIKKYVSLDKVFGLQCEKFSGIRLDCGNICSAIHPASSYESGSYIFSIRMKLESGENIVTDLLCLVISNSIFRNSQLCKEIANAQTSCLQNPTETARVCFTNNLKKMSIHTIDEPGAELLHWEGSLPELPRDFTIKTWDANSAIEMQICNYSKLTFKGVQKSPKVCEYRIKVPDLIHQFTILPIEKGKKYHCIGPFEIKRRRHLTNGAPIPKGNSLYLMNQQSSEATSKRPIEEQNLESSKKRKEFHERNDVIIIDDPQNEITEIYTSVSTQTTDEFDEQANANTPKETKDLYPSDITRWENMDTLCSNFESIIEFKCYLLGYVLKQIELDIIFKCATPSCVKTCKEYLLWISSAGGIQTLLDRLWDDFQKNGVVQDALMVSKHFTIFSDILEKVLGQVNNLDQSESDCEIFLEEILIRYTDMTHKQLSKQGRFKEIENMGLVAILSKYESKLQELRSIDALHVKSEELEWECVD